VTFHTISEAEPIGHQM